MTEDQTPLSQLEETIYNAVSAYIHQGGHPNALGDVVQFAIDDATNEKAVMEAGLYSVKAEGLLLH